MLIYKNTQATRRYLNAPKSRHRYSPIGQLFDSAFRIHKAYLESEQWMIYNSDTNKPEGPFNNLQAALDEGVNLLGERIGSVEIHIGSTFPVVYACQRKHKGMLELKIEENWEPLARIAAELMNA